MVEHPAPSPPSLGPTGGAPPRPPPAPGRRDDEPPTDAFIPPPRLPRPRPAGGAWGGEDDAGKHEPSGPTRPSINPLSSALAALGNGVKVKLRRTSPNTLPQCELGWTPWMDIGLPTPTADDVQDFILQKFGGGEFLVLLRGDNAQSNEQDSIKIPLMGDWIAQTIEGQAVKQQQLARGGAMPTALPSGAPGGGSEGMAVVAEAMKYAHEDKAQARELSQKTADAQANALVQLATVLKPADGAVRPPGTDVPALLAAITPLVLGYLENQRAERARADERDRADRAAAEARLERALAAAAQQNQPSALAKAAELQMDLMGKVATRAVEQALTLAMGAGKTETEVGPIRAALARLIGDSGPAIAALGAAALPKLLSGFQGGGAGAPGPAPMPAPPGMPSGTAQVPVFVPTTPPGGPGAPQPAQGPPSPAAGPAPAVATEPPGPSPTQPERAAVIWLAAATEWCGTKPEPAAGWQFPVEGMALAVVFGMAPPPFRAAVQAVDPEAPGPLVPGAWVAGLHPHVAAAAAALDAALHGPAATPGAEEWLRAFLDQGPWIEDDDEPEDAP